MAQAQKMILEKLTSNNLDLNAALQFECSRMQKAINVVCEYSEN
jgi:hypothetical protein